ncbi:kinase-like protein, partial [Sistotremastrum niveocremeum HHB9708]
IRKELRLWHSLNHMNILSFKGVCFFPLGVRDESLFAMVSPWMRNGTIREYLKNSPEVDRLDMMIGIIDGLAYLHEKNIVHGDLKGANILVTEEGYPVLTDFGVSILMEDDAGFFTESVISSTTNLKGTARFMAPELFHENSDGVNFSTDMWAFGCVTVEVVCGSLPYAESKHDPQVICSILTGKRPHAKGFETSIDPPPFPVTRNKHLEMICDMCWNFDPRGRPTASSLTQQL